MRRVFLESIDDFILIFFNISPSFVEITRGNILNASPFFKKAVKYIHAFLRIGYIHLHVRFRINDGETR